MGTVLLIFDDTDMRKKIVDWALLMIKELPASNFRHYFLSLDI